MKEIVKLLPGGDKIPNEVGFGAKELFVFYHEKALDFVKIFSICFKTLQKAGIIINYNVFYTGFPRGNPFSNDDTTHTAEDLWENYSPADFNAISDYLYKQTDQAIIMALINIRIFVALCSLLASEFLRDYMLVYGHTILDTIYVHVYDRDNGNYKYTNLKIAQENIYKNNRREEAWAKICKAYGKIVLFRGSTSYDNLPIGGYLDFSFLSTTWDPEAALRFSKVLSGNGKQGHFYIIVFEESDGDLPRCVNLTAHRTSYFDESEVLFVGPVYMENVMKDGNALEHKVKIQAQRIQPLRKLYIEIKKFIQEWYFDYTNLTGFNNLNFSIITLKKALDDLADPTETGQDYPISPPIVSDDFFPPDVGNHESDQ